MRQFDDHDGSSLVVRRLFFCGGERDEFDRRRKGLDSLSAQKAKKKLDSTLKIEIDDEAFERLYGFRSHPIMPSHEGQRHEGGGVQPN